MQKTHYIYLIPGFFGFSNIGEFHYFSHPYAFLQERAAARSMSVEIIRVRTLPTASLRKRTRYLLDVISSTYKSHGPHESNHSNGHNPIHLIGHSTGGLDARLLVTPGVTLGAGTLPADIIAAVRSVVSISTPHYGTPLASFFGSKMGQPLLRLLSLATVYTLRFGHLPLSFALKLAGLFFRLDNAVGWRDTIVDQLFGELLENFSPDRRAAVADFFRQVGADQALVFQLTPDAMDVFNAATADNPQVHYGSVLSQGRHPGLGGRLAAGLDPYAHVTHTAYMLMHRFTSKMRPDALPDPHEAQTRQLRLAYGKKPPPADNDGVVPTLSQLWGHVLKATRADHLDIIGHFGDHSRTPPHVDWLASGSEFDRIDFEDTWNKILSFMADAAAGRSDRLQS